MLGQNRIDQFAAQVTAIGAAIKDLEAQLTQLREEKKALEVQAQGVMTLVGAGRSALEQAANFLKMAKQLGENEMMAEFLEDIKELIEQPIYQEIEGAQDIETEVDYESENEPKDEDEDEDEEVLKVTAEEVEGTIEVTVVNPDDEQFLLRVELGSKNINELRTQAKELGLDVKGKKHELVQRILEVIQQPQG